MHNICIIQALRALRKGPDVHGNRRVRSTARLATRWPLELHNIAFWVADVDRRAFSFGSVPSCQWPGFYVVSVKLAADCCFIERLYSKAEVIEVPSFFRRWRTTGLAKRTVNWHEVNQRAPGAKLHQPNGVLASFDRAPKYSAVKAKHAIEVHHAQDKVINLADANHGAWSGSLTCKLSGGPPAQPANGAEALAVACGDHSAGAGWPSRSMTEPRALRASVNPGLIRSASE